MLFMGKKFDNEIKLPQIYFRVHLHFKISRIWPHRLQILKKKHTEIQIKNKLRYVTQVSNIGSRASCRAFRYIYLQPTLVQSTKHIRIRETGMLFHFVLQHFWCIIQVNTTRWRWRQAWTPVWERMYFTLTRVLMTKW